MATIKSIKEKAKAYDEAIEKIQKYVKDDYGCTRLRPEDIFPELKESEDKRIRERIIALVNAHGQGMYKDEMIAWLEKQGEQEPDEEYNITGIHSKHAEGKLGEMIKNLKSVNEMKVEPRFNMEQKPAWSEEDEKIINSFLHKLEVCDLLSNKEGLWIKNKLKDIKDRVQPKQEWSEEDKNRFTNLISLVKCSKENDATKVGFIEFINKLKSLSLKTTWKPSDKQLKMLDEIIDVLHRMQLFGGSNALIELKYDLKKLRGE